MTETITGLFEAYQEAETAVRDLEAAGVPHKDISLVANDTHGEHAKTAKMASKAGEDAGKGAGLGAAIGGAGGLLAGLGVLAVPGLGPVVAAGWLVSTIAAAVGGAAIGGAAGGIVGALTKAGVSEEDAHAYAEGVRRGGSLVTARVDDGLVTTARAILNGEHAVDIAGRREVYRGEGWSTFDDTAATYTPQEVAAERARYDRV